MAACSSAGGGVQTGSLGGGGAEGRGEFPEAPTAPPITDPPLTAWPLSGLPLADPAAADHAVVAVKIDAAPRARPQTGINDADICDLALACMTELRAAAAAEGRDIPEQAAHFLLEGTKAMKPYAPSMKVDYDAGRQLEVEALLGEPLSRANRIGVEMPTIAALYRQLRFLNQRLQPHQPAHRPREQ